MWCVRILSGSFIITWRLTCRKHTCADRQPSVLFMHSWTRRQFSRLLKISASQPEACKHRWYNAWFRDYSPGVISVGDSHLCLSIAQDRCLCWLMFLPQENAVLKSSSVCIFVCLQNLRRKSSGRHDVLQPCQWKRAISHQAWTVDRWPVTRKGSVLEILDTSCRTFYCSRGTIDFSVRSDTHVLQF